MNAIVAPPGKRGTTTTTVTPRNSAGPSYTAPPPQPWVSAPEVLAELAERYKRGQQRQGYVTTGLRYLDRLARGFGPGQLVLLAGRPGSGKSALGLQVAAHVSVSHGPVLYVTLEMDRYEVAGRLVQQAAQVSSDEIDERRIAAVVNRHPRLHVLDEIGALEQVQSVADAFAREHQDTAMIVVDYLGLLRVRNTSTSTLERISLIARELKALAQRLHVPLLALVQLRRPDRKQAASTAPTLCDLRDSGELEQAANKVLLLNYGGEEVGDRTVEAILAKNREGPTGTVDLWWMPSIVTFRGVEPMPEQVSLL